MICFLPIVLTGCKRAEEYNHYIITAIYDAECKTLTCEQTVEYVNKSDNFLNEIYFHLYPNAFRQGAEAKVVSLANENKAYLNGKSYGCIEISSIEKTENVYDYLITGVDCNILAVKLVEGVYPNEKVVINMNYVVTLPNVNHRFGYGDNTINFGNFYPIACVYEDGKGFVTDLYHSNGDPFYSDCSNYSVTISYPESMIISNTGDGKTKVQNGVKKTDIKANKVRDFAFVLSDKFEVASQSVDGIMVNYYYYDDENVSDNLLVAVKAIKTFNSLFGKYPYQSVNVVKSNFIHGGMEYPNLVLISDADMAKEDYQYIIIHELAHQWWYGVVGNNEYVNSWQDEGLTEYSTALFYENNPEYNLQYDSIINGVTKNYKLFVEVYSKVNGSVNTSMNRRLDEYLTEPEYVNCTYAKGTLLFDSFRQSVGDKKFFKALKNYYKKFMYKNCSTEEFIACMVESCGYTLESFFENWIEGKVAIL